MSNFYQTPWKLLKTLQNGVEPTPPPFVSVPFYGKLLQPIRDLRSKFYRLCNIRILYPFTYGKLSKVLCIWMSCRANDENMSCSGDSDMTFYIDSRPLPVATFFRPSSRDNSFEFNVLVFATNSLLPDNHTLTIQNGRPGGPKALLILDYIIYSRVLPL